MSEIKTYTGYGAYKLLWDFLAVSYEGGPDYKNYLDAHGNELFIQHELETGKRANRRRRHATYKNYARTIADKFRDYVYRRDVAWPEADGKPKLQDFLDNCDLDDTTLQQYCRNATMMAQVFGEALVGFDSNPVPDGMQASTQAQASALGQRLYLTLTDIRRMVDYESDGKEFTRLVLEERTRIKKDFSAEERTIVSYIQWTP